MEACEAMKDQQIKGRPASGAEGAAKSGNQSGKRPASRRQSGQPRGSIPIHVDGSRDELAEVDPDLTLAELDWRWTREGDGEGQLGGGGGQSNKIGRPYSTGCISFVTRTSGNQSSRARPIKPHETEPFLAVNGIVKGVKQTPGSGLRTVSSSADQQKSKVKLQARGQRVTSCAFSSVVSGRACGTPSSQSALCDTFRSPYSSPTPSVRIHSALSQGRRSVTGRMYVSPNSVSPRPNPNVKLPFKHNIRPPTQTPGQEPSQDLKERTALATYHVHRLLLGSRGGSRPKQRGRLQQKGRLKPLYPVSISGPTITQCRGILSETREYTPSLSRTLQHRRRIMAHLKSGDLGENTEHLAEGCESVHRVSAASSLEDFPTGGSGEEEEEEEEGITEEEIAAMEEEAAKEEETMPGSPHPPHQTSATPEQSKNTDTPQPGDEGATTLTSELTDKGQTSAEEMMDMSEGKTEHADNSEIIHTETSKMVTQVEDNVSNPVEKKEKENRITSSNGSIGDAAKTNQTTTTLVSSNANNYLDNSSKILQPSTIPNQSSSNPRVSQPQVRFNGELKRPQSASVQYSEPVATKSPTKARPRTAVSVKTVRFADLIDSSDGTRGSLSGSGTAAGSETATKGGEEAGKKRGGSGQSCKPADFNSPRHDDDDDDKDGGGGGGEGRKAGRTSAGGAARDGGSSGAGEAIGAQPPSSQPQQSDSHEMRQTKGSADAHTVVFAARQPENGSEGTNHVAGVPVMNSTLQDSVHTASVPTSASPVMSQISLAQNHTAPSSAQAASTSVDTASRVHTSSSIKSVLSAKTASNVKTAFDMKSASNSNTVKMSSNAVSNSNTASNINTASDVVTPSCFVTSPASITAVTRSSSDAIPGTDSDTALSLGVTALRTMPSSQRPVEERCGMVWQSPPVTWTPGEKLSSGSVLDSTNLWRLLLDVSSQVTSLSTQVTPLSGQLVPLADQVTPFSAQGDSQDMSPKRSQLTDQAASLCVELEPDHNLASRQTGLSIVPADVAECSSSDTMLPQTVSMDVVCKDVAYLASGDEERSLVLCDKPDHHDTVPQNRTEHKHLESAARRSSETHHATAKRSSEQVKTRPTFKATHNTQQQTSSVNLSSEPSDRQKLGKKKTAASSVTMIHQSDSGVNPRIGVFVCHHRDSPSKTPGALGLLQDVHRNNEDGKLGYRPPQKMVGRNLASNDARLVDSNLGEDPDDLSLSKLFTHFSLGMGSPRSPQSGAGGDYSTQTSHPKQQQHSLQAAVGERDTSSSRQSMVAGILKKKKVVSGTETEERKSHTNQLLDRQADPCYESQFPPQSKKTHKRQIFTHRSSQPFVFPSEDPFSQAVADQLKFGNSPYLQYLQLAKSKSSKPQRRWETSTTQRERSTVLTRQTESASSAGDEKTRGRPRHGEMVHSGDRSSVPTWRHPRATKVQFADCCVHVLDVNHSCLPSEQPCTVCKSQAHLKDITDAQISTTPQLEICKHDTKMQRERYTCDGDMWTAEKEPGVVGASWLHQKDSQGTYSHSEGGDYSEHGAVETLYDDGVNSGEDQKGMEGGFAALEAELCAVRTQLQQDILLSQTQVAHDAEDGDSMEHHLTSNDQNFSDFDDDDDGFVYEDDGSSDDDDKTDMKDENRNENTDDKDDDNSDDDDETYSTLYRALLLDYRQKCMMAGEGNLVISDKLTWPMVAQTHTTPSPTTKPSRPYSAGAFRTLGERRQIHTMPKHHHSLLDMHTQPGLSRSVSQSDSGWESDQDSDSRGQMFSRWNSLLSVDGESVSSHGTHSTSSVTHTAATTNAKREDSAEKSGESTKLKESKRGEQCRGNWHVTPGQFASRPSSGQLDHPQFQIVASSAPKIPARSRAAPSTGGPTAPFPPLCFAVNGRAPPGYVFFFTYANYMNADRLGTLIHRQVDKRYWAILFGFELTFNKLGGEECSGGLPNIMFNPFSSVEGCVVLLTPEELHCLDAFTGAPQHYSRVVLPVWMSDMSGDTEDCGLAKHCVAAITYIATDEWSVKDDCPPNEFAASQCLKSADLLTPNYRERLQSLVCESGLPQPVVPDSEDLCSPLHGNPVGPDLGYCHGLSPVASLVQTQTVVS